MQPRENEKKDKNKQKKKRYNEMSEIDYIWPQSHATESSQQHEARNKKKSSLLSWDVESTKCNLLGLETVCSSLESSKESES
ncbi:hypothetical protein AVEN_125743-1, partial [Araneus ventricosus]